MRWNRTSSARFFLLLLLILLTTFSIMSVEARKNHGKKSKMHHDQHKKQKNNKGNVTPPGTSYSPASTNTTIFDVLSFGAMGDGISDDSKVNIILSPS